MKKYLIILILLMAIPCWGADTKISALTEDETVLTTDIGVTVEDPGGSPATKKATWANILGANLTAIRGLTFVDASILQLTGAGAAAVLTSGGNYYTLMSNSDNSALAFVAPADVVTALGVISDTAYGASWDGVTTISPSKNAVYDEFVSVIAGYPTAASLHMDDILTALGIASEATHLGTFTGSTIEDNQTAKAAIQALETALELKATASSLATDNATASHLLCKDSDGHIENCGGVTISGTTSPIININPQEVDCHVTSTNLTAAQVSNTVLHNYDQAASDVFTILPAAAAGYSFLANIVTAQSNHFCVEADADDKIYLIAAAGTVAAGDNGAGVCMVAAQLGQSFACWTFKSGATSYDWMCKAISIGTSTFEAHASSE